MLLPKKVLLVGIEVPSRATDIHEVMGRLKHSSRHQVAISVVPMASGRGKFENITEAIRTAPEPVENYEWLVIVDDDIAFNQHMFDDLLDLSEQTCLMISQPAHRHVSYVTYALTVRQREALVRTTRFVEIGPVTAINHRVFKHLLPFPPSRWGYGIDVLWSEIIKAKSYRMGIVDAATISHLRPVANNYSLDAARAEGETLLNTMPITQTRAEMLTLGTICLWR